VRKYFLASTITLFTITLGCGAVVSPETMADATKTIVADIIIAFEIIAGLGALFVAGLGVLLGINRIIDNRQKQGEVELQKAEIRLLDAKAQREREESSVTVVSGKYNDKMYIYNHLTGESTALHMQMAYSQNRAMIPTAQDRSDFAAFHLLAKTPPKTVTNNECPDWLAEIYDKQKLIGSGDSSPELLPLLVESERNVIAGGSGSGKSDITKHLVAARLERGDRIIYIDPHSPSTVLGVEAIGGGRDYESISDALSTLAMMMTGRYADVARDVIGYGEAEDVSIFIDEWTSIVEERPETRKFIKQLLTESRKVNFHLTVLTHALNVETMGVNASILRSAVQTQLTGKLAKDGETVIEPFTAKVVKFDTDHLNRKRLVEHVRPEPFGDGNPTMVDESLIIDLPKPREAAVFALKREGKSDTAIAKEIFKRKKRATSKDIQAVRAILDNYAEFAEKRP